MTTTIEQLRDYMKDVKSKVEDMENVDIVEDLLEIERIVLFHFTSKSGKVTDYPMNIRPLKTISKLIKERSQVK